MSGAYRWVCQAGERGRVYVYPLNDRYPHEIGAEAACPCNPVETPVYSEGEYRGVIVTHNSYDGRELLERKYSEVKL